MVKKKKKSEMIENPLKITLDGTTVHESLKKYCEETRINDLHYLGYCGGLLGAGDKNKEEYIKHLIMSYFFAGVYLAKTNPSKVKIEKDKELNAKKEKPTRVNYFG